MIKNPKILFHEYRLAIFAFLLFFLFPSNFIRAQELNQTGQLWMDFITDFYTGDIGLLDVDLAFNQWIGARDEWNEVMFTPIYELYPNYRFDLFGGVVLSRVQQNSNSLTIETRPLAGFRLNFSTSRNKLFVRYRFRYEWRHFNYLDGDSASSYSRVRNRIEATISLTQANYQMDNNLYLKADFEIFNNLDEAPGERFVNNTRTRLGLGYRLNPAWRFEFLYTFQTSINNIGENRTESVDHIFRIFFKKYFFY